MFFKKFKVKIIALISGIEVPYPIFSLPTDVADFSLKYLRILEVRREEHNSFLLSELLNPQGIMSDVCCSLNQGK